MSEQEFRVGQGFDVHAWSDDPTRVLILGGEVFEGFPGLAGHSDSDALAHACTDAVLSGAGLGDIGAWFPDTDSSLAGADSVELLAQASAALRSVGWRVCNIDATVICDEPKIGPHREEIQKRLSTAVGAPVTVKGKRTEGLAALAGGVQCHAVALLAKGSV